MVPVEVSIQFGDEVEVDASPSVDSSLTRLAAGGDDGGTAAIMSDVLAVSGETAVRRGELELTIDA